jgi:hypothetical protein
LIKEATGRSCLPKKVLRIKISTAYLGLGWDVGALAHRRSEEGVAGEQGGSHGYDRHRRKAKDQAGG